MKHFTITATTAAVLLGAAAGGQISNEVAASDIDVSGTFEVRTALGLTGTSLQKSEFLLTPELSYLTPYHPLNRPRHPSELYEPTN